MNIARVTYVVTVSVSNKNGQTALNLASSQMRFQMKQQQQFSQRKISMNLSTILMSANPLTYSISRVSVWKIRLTLKSAGNLMIMRQILSICQILITFSKASALLQSPHMSVREICSCNMIIARPHKVI